MVDVPGQIGPYRLVERLGHGGTCEVFLATAFGASGFEKAIAIKTLLPEYRQEADYQRQFIREARVGAHLDHRNLVAVHDFGASQGVHYLRMDLVDGSDLERLQTPRGIGAGLAIFVAAEVALALDYLHRCTDRRGRPLRLVHRDVSPSNVLISKSGEVKLADYGILKATAYADITRGNIRKGKYAYMSPEQLAGAKLTHASDQFALGAMLVELVTGRHPFAAQDVVGTMDRIQSAADPDLDGLDEGLERVTRRCLRPEPADRYPDARSLYAELRRLLSGLEPQPGPLALAEFAS
jgi:eukaryotic-like serine/threonine-protein kinase